MHSHLDSDDMGGGVGIWFSKPALTTACCAIDFNEDMESELCKNKYIPQCSLQKKYTCITCSLK